jgi:hypothetical protein
MAKRLAYGPVIADGANSTSKRSQYGSIVAVTVTPPHAIVVTFCVISYMAS